MHRTRVSMAVLRQTTPTVQRGPSLKDVMVPVFVWHNLICTCGSPRGRL